MGRRQRRAPLTVSASTNSTLRRLDTQNGSQKALHANIKLCQVFLFNARVGVHKQHACMQKSATCMQTPSIVFKSIMKMAEIVQIEQSWNPHKDEAQI